MSFIFGGVDLEALPGVTLNVNEYINQGGLALDLVDTPGTDGRFYGGSRRAVTQIPFNVTIIGTSQVEADARRLEFIRAIDPSRGPQSLRLDAYPEWHYEQTTLAGEIAWEKTADSRKVAYQGSAVFETVGDPAMRRVNPELSEATGTLEYTYGIGSTSCYPTLAIRDSSGGDYIVRVGDFELELTDVPAGGLPYLSWDDFTFYTREFEITYAERYEWSGTPHNSESVKYEYGVESERNYVPNPSFEEGIDNVVTAGNNVIESFYSTNYAYSGVRSLSFRSQNDSTAGNSYAMQVFYIDPEMWGKWGAFAVRGMKPFSSGPNYYRLRIQLQIGSSTIETDSGNYLSLPRTRELWTPTTLQISEGIERIRVLTWFFGTAAYTAPDPGVVISDGWKFSIADTEAEALAQVETYFDGDTPDVMDQVIQADRVHPLVPSMSTYERPVLYPGQTVNISVTKNGAQVPFMFMPNARRA